jgi:D-psicose/D-tagatose/L-ribulose 3-epimerase
MNVIGVHALVWAGDTSAESVRRAVRCSAEAGYDLVEFSLHDSLGLDVSSARAELERAGLAVACSRGLAFDADISSDDPVVVTRGAQLLADSLRVSHELGASILTGALYSALGKYAAPLSAAGRANVVSVLRDLAEEADRLGMTLGLEICNRYETNVLNTAAEALRLADDIGADNVGIHLDTYHMNIEEDDLVRPVRQVGQRLSYVHIGENHRGYLGSGHLDFGAFFHALADIDYAGPITFESFSSAVVSARLTGDLAIWRNLWTDGEDLARHALGYIRAGLTAAAPGRTRSTRWSETAQDAGDQPGHQQPQDHRDAVVDH